VCACVRACVRACMCVRACACVRVRACVRSELSERAWMDACVLEAVAATHSIPTRSRRSVVPAASAWAGSRMNLLRLQKMYLPMDAATRMCGMIAGTMLPCIANNSSNAVGCGRTIISGGCRIPKEYCSKLPPKLVAMVGFSLFLVASVRVAARPPAPTRTSPAAAATPGFSCDGETGTSINITLTQPIVPSTDWWYIAIRSTAGGPLLGFQTFAGVATTLVDVLPGQTYALLLRRHPGTEQLVWGWQDATGVTLSCSTAAEDGAGPHKLHRVHGTGPHHDLVELEWQAAAAPTAVPKATTHVGWRVVGTGDAFVSSREL
jgi:hypothetical protein